MIPLPLQDNWGPFAPGSIVVTRQLNSFRQRFLAHLDMLFVDHGLFRELYNNFHALPGGLYRCSQPSPRQIRKYHRKYGIKTIINLRGADATRRYALEEQACRELGITLVNHKGILSRSAPTIEAIERSRALFETIEYPALLHCKSGADRAGFAAALYRTLRLHESIETARNELAWYYGHLKWAKTGILDAFFERYLAASRTTPQNFLDWLHNGYEREALKRDFNSRGWADWITDRLLDRE